MESSPSTSILNTAEVSIINDIIASKSTVEEILAIINPTEKTDRHLLVDYVDLDRSKLLYAKGKGKGKGSKRFTGNKKETALKNISAPAIRRLARRGGVVRVGNGIYDTTRTILEEFLRKVIKNTVLYTEHARRKTVTAMDVVYALKNHGKILYGFNENK